MNEKSKLTTAGAVPPDDGRDLRLVVTGIKDDGLSVIVSDGPPQLLRQSGPGAFMGDFWKTDSLPKTNQDGYPPLSYSLEPEGAGGVSFRVASVAPQKEEEENLAQKGGGFGMHQTDTIDFITIISGEIYLKLDDGSETLLKPKDSVVQRGTDHAWINRGEVPCVFSAVMVKPAIATLNGSNEH